MRYCISKIIKEIENVSRRGQESYNWFMVSDYDHQIEVDSSERVGSESIEIPFALREYGEIPEGYVPVYVVIDRKSLQYVAGNGLRVEDNQIGKKHPDLEKIFNEVNKEWTKPIERTRCVFAYPVHPSQAKLSKSYDPERHVIIEAMVDPNNVRTYVADSEYYTMAFERMIGIDGIPSLDWEADVRDSAERYWASAISLSEYLRGKKEGEYTSAEILIQDDIPTSRLKLVS
ncbi:MAG: hypothetical protein ACD_61C00152G0002 [uncultured bacterium]|uniref:Uncharacterized protein n=1 Tax=Candidatus Collierbacteria bacterium GW2011_GWC2_44_18 TaxID=1618392 RepID=A0A0G1HPM4_9BACT|nr:MAG: hypothetical protein ACD_61C00152G0002 [uncultured bacterium]KKT49096.1 MAG: hypothetical protein UW41_C0012G0034 [Candidatus Collierbacteria bacterium GW2011_GWC2_44_18]